MTIFLILAFLVVLLLTGAPIFAALGVASLIIMLLTEGNVNSVADTVFAKLNNEALTAIPMFAFMAHVMVRARVVAAISGSSVATALTIGSSAIPQMRRFGYRATDAYGVIAAGGTLGILIPPSGPLILYAIVTESSIGALFLAGKSRRGRYA